MTRCPICGSSVDGRTCGECGTTVQSERSERDRRADGDTARQTNGRAALPTGIKLLCGWLVLSGIGSLVAGLQVLQYSQAVAAYGAGGLLGLAGVLLLGFGGAELAAAVGLWTRKSWGWVSGLCVAGGGILTSLLLVASPFTTVFGVVGLLSNAAVGWYLYRQRWRYRSGSGAQHASQL